MTSLPTTPLTPSPASAILGCMNQNFPLLAERIAHKPTACRVLSIFGTRPEVIKFYPVLEEMSKHEQILSVVCVTGQHRQMIDPLLSLFNIKTDIDLNLMTSGQTLSNLSAKLFTSLAPVFEAVRPQLVLVQGDTTTAMIASMCAFYYRVPVGHIEAGLRTNDRYNPFPEEVNRRIISVVGNLHFAPTQHSADALKAERIDPESIFVTGNTVIDAILLIKKLEPSSQAKALLERVDAATAATAAALKTAGKEHMAPRHILLTAHRRENHGAGIASICRAVRRIVAQHPDVNVWYPVHMNPAVCVPVREALGSVERVHLLDPLEYDVFVHFLDRMYMVMTDSGGIQEEVTALAKPTLVLRETTERPEGVEAGVTRLVGTEEDSIVTNAHQLLTDATVFTAMSRKCYPFGDGTSAKMIVDLILNPNSKVTGG